MNSEVHGGNNSQESATGIGASIEEENEGTNSRGNVARLQFVFRKISKAHGEKNADRLNDSYSKSTLSSSSPNR